MAKWKLWDRCADCNRKHLTKAGAWAFTITVWTALLLIFATTT